MGTERKLLNREARKKVREGTRRVLTAALTLVLALGNVLGMFAPAAAHADDGYSYTFENGGTVWVSADGDTITGTCRLTGGHIDWSVSDGSWGAYRSTAVMPDGASLPAACYESYIGKPDHALYPGPCDGSYSFTATRQGSGDYFVLVHSQDAAGGAPETNPVPPGYTYQRVYAQRWTPDIKVTVNFTKISADATVTDGNSEYAYAGATYDIYRAGTGAYVDTITTDKNGHADLKLEPDVSYYAVETKAPQGFKLNTERIYFNTTTTDSAVNLVDDPGTLYFFVQKKDSATLGEPQAGASLEGAEYTLVDANGNTHVAHTDSSGFIMFGDPETDGVLPFGTCTIVETKAPTGYKLDSTVRTYTVHADQMTDAGIVELEPEDDFIENPVAFDIEIAKFLGTDAAWDESDGHENPAAGVQFEIVSNTSGEVVGTLTTNEQGFASTKDASTVNAEAVSEDATHDASKPWMGSGKRNEGISGALPYDEAGYTIHEVEGTVPDGFDHVEDWTISASEMADGSCKQFICNDQGLNTRIQIVKTDAETGNTVPLPGFSFQIEDAEGNLVTMTDWYPNETVLDTFVTDESGMVTLPERLAPGDYTLVEVEAAAPYLKGGAEVGFGVSSDYENAEVLTLVSYSDEQAKGKATIAKLCETDGAASDSDSAIDEGCSHELSGAEFDVVAVDDVVSPDGTVRAVAGEVVDHVTTGEDGTATTKELYLGSGSATYAFVETKAPEGHVLDTTPHEFALAYADDGTPLVTATVEATDAPTETVLDKGVVGTDDVLPGAEFALWEAGDEIGVEPAEGYGALAVRLAEEPERSLLSGFLGTGGTEVKAVEHVSHGLLSVDLPDGCSLMAVSDDGERVEIDPASGPAASFLAPGSYTLVLSKDGSDQNVSGDTSLDVEAGRSYSFKASVSVNGYRGALADDGSCAAEYALTYDGDKDAYVSAEIPEGNYAVLVGGEEVGSVRVAHGKASYAEVADDELVEMPVLLAADADPVHAVTDGSGRIVVKHLASGSYRIKEVSAPAGYLVDDAVHYFAIDGDGMTEGMASFGIEVEDDYTKVDLSKRDITNEDEIPGAQLAVLDADGEVVDAWTSTEEDHRINALAPGTYTFVEEMTPKTYDEATAVEFTVLATGEVQTVVMYDEPIKVTGELDKRQEIADPTRPYTVANGDGQNKAEVTVSEEGYYDYSLDYRSTSTTWVDEFTVTDALDAVGDGTAMLVGVTTAQGFEDYDGLMNVWYKTDQTPDDYVDESAANATLSDGHANPWLTHESNAEVLGDDGRVIDYTGWKLWAEGVSTTEATELAVADLGLAEGEKVTAIRFEYGRVEEGFTTRTDEWDRTNLKSGHDDLDDVQATHGGEGFEVEPCNILTLADGTTLTLSDEELAAAEDGAGYMVDPDGDGTPEFVATENVERVTEAAYAPAILHMQVTDAYTKEVSLDNSATLDLYRNGGGTDLEDHDKDFVTQIPKEELPEIGTTLTDAEDGDHIVAPGKVTLTDTVGYTGLEVGVEHTLTGTLMDKATGKPVTGKDGTEVTATTTFTPEDADGEVDVAFEFDASDLDGHDVVAFEVMTIADTETVTDEESGEETEQETERVVATHEDIDDEGQTVKIRSNPTLLDQTGSNLLAAAGVCAAAAAVAAGVYAYRRRKAKLAGATGDGSPDPDGGPDADPESAPEPDAKATDAPDASDDEGGQR